MVTDQDTERYETMAADRRRHVERAISTLRREANAAATAEGLHSSPRMREPTRADREVAAAARAADDEWLDAHFDEWLLVAYQAGVVVREMYRGWETPELLDQLDLIGVAEVARITGLTENSVRTYVARRSITEPLRVAGSDALVWDRAKIESWHAHRRGPGRPGLED